MTHVVLETPEDLRVLMLPKKSSFKLAISSLGAENAAWEERLRRDYDECGCTAGTMGLIAGLTAGATAAWFLGLVWWQCLTSGIAVGLLCLALAKTIRLSLARNGIRRSIAQIDELVRRQS